MTLAIPYTLGETSITFFFGARQRTYAKEHHNFAAIKSAVMSGNMQDIEAAINLAQIVAKATFGKVVICDDDAVRFNGTLVPEYLAHRILEHFQMDEINDASPIVHFAEKLMGNVTDDVRTDMYKWLENGKMPIFPDGDFIAYKLVNHDYSPIHKGPYGKSQKPGEIVEMPRSACNALRGISCSTGLHFCSYNYLPAMNGGESWGTRKVIVLKINPADVVAIPTDYNLTKGRCCRFEVIGEIDPAIIAEEFGGKLVVSNFGTYTDEELSKKSVDAIKKEFKESIKNGWKAKDNSNIKVTLSEQEKQERRQKGEDAITRNNGSKTAAAKELGIPRSTLYNWLNS